MLNDLLRRAGEMEASDVHITVGARPMVRVQGRLQPLQPAAVAESVLTEALALLPEKAAAELARNGEADCVWGLEQGRRCRVNIYRQNGSYALAARLLSAGIPDCAALGLPEALCRTIWLRQGLVLVTGPTGSGKTTTLASLVQEINRSRAVHIIALEDPVEYCYEPGLALIHQREVGRDTATFAAGLRSALREDPDVILVGEMRDSETMGIVLTAAETGHLVLATMHTGDVAGSLSRIADALPQRRQQVRAQLAECLQVVACQRLLPRSDGRGRVAAFELLAATDAVRALIREGQNHQLKSFIQTGGRFGMMTMEASIDSLRRRGII